jgi:glycosyltransferase involved in cell wall biosynthesis
MLRVTEPMPNCRILYLIGQLHSGGSERQLYYLLESMDRSRYRPAVAVWNFSEKEIYVPQIRKIGVSIYCLPNVPLASAKLAALRRLVKQLKPEIVHSFSFYLNFAAYWGVRGTDAVALGSMRSALHLDKRVNGWLLGKLSARWPRTQIYNSFEAANYKSNSRSLFLPKRVLVVPNGVDLQYFNVVPVLVTTPIRILAVGSLVPVKRWDRLLLATAELKRRRLDFSVELVGDGPLYKSLGRQVEKLGISDRLTLRGYTDDIPALLSSASFLVHTSDAEGSPNSIMEAMACGRAVVATSVGDVASLVEDGTTGFVVHRGDDAMLIECMATLISNRDLCGRMGEAGRAKAEREFRLDRLVSETLAVYRAAGWNDARPCKKSFGADCRDAGLNS